MSSVVHLVPYSIWIALCTSTFTLLIWRIWKFTIKPRIYTDEPKELPYWLPFVGHLSWQILYQYPGFLSSKMHAAKARVTEALRKYFDTPMSERSGDAWFTKAMENEMRDLNLNTQDISIMMQTIYWGINTNTRRGCFWMLSFMLFNPQVIPLVMQETEKAFVGGSTTPDIDYLNDQCPMTNSVESDSAHGGSIVFGSIHYCRYHCWRTQASQREQSYGSLPPASFRRKGVR